MSEPESVPYRVLVAGIGNIFLGDDGFGCEVIRRLNGRTFPENVRVIDFGIRGFDLAYALLDGYDATVFVDATPRGGEPGTLYTIEPELSEIESIGGNGVMVEAHDMNPIKVLGMVKSMGGVFKKILLVGCEPATLGPEEGQMGLSDEVEAVIDQAAATVESVVARLLEENRTLAMR